MACPGPLMKLMHSSRMSRPLLTQTFQQRLAINGSNMRHSHNTHNKHLFSIWPQTRLLKRPSIFSYHILARHWDVLPILFGTMGAVTCETLWTIRQMFTRDDVRSLFTKKMAIDKHDYTARDPPPRRKGCVINQKYEWPPGLLDALEALKDPNESPSKK